MNTARQAYAKVVGARPAVFRIDRPAVFTFPHMSRFDLWAPSA